MAKRKRKNFDELSWSESVEFDEYDITRYFIKEYNQFPNNTILMGSDYKRGLLSFDLFVDKIKEMGAKFLHRSETYSTGVRKLFFDLDGTVFMLQSVYDRMLKDFKSYPKELEEKDKTVVKILGSLTLLHVSETLDEKYREIINACYIKPITIHTIGMIARDNTGFFLNEIKLETEELSHELDLHYGEGFEKFHELLIDKLATTSKGLSLFHGKPGTGKSFYIKKLIYDITELTNKKIIFLPASMVNYLTDPEFNTFMFEISESYDYDEEEYEEDETEEKKFGKDGIILLLEDAESVLHKRDSFGGNGQSTSNILNLTDGILNDLFNIQIIATYNTKDENIDPALKREKRLLAKREFKNLDINGGKALADFLEIDSKEIEKEMSVAEIYSLLDESDNSILIDKTVVKKGKHLI